MPDRGDDVVRRFGDACQAGDIVALLSNHADALVEAQDWAWNTMFWGVCFALVLGPAASVSVAGPDHIGELGAGELQSADRGR